MFASANERTEPSARPHSTDGNPSLELTVISLHFEYFPAAATRPRSTTRSSHTGPVVEWAEWNPTARERDWRVVATCQLIDE